MKKTNLIYWVLTGLFGGLMLFSSIFDILVVPDAITYMTHLGYPVYIIPFIGVAKALGAIAILIPGFPRIKEWAYAGLIYDLLGAMYSIMSVEKTVAALPLLLPLVLATGSYIFYHKRLKEKTLAVANQS